MRLMNYTQYFIYTRNRPDRQRIKEEWIQLVVEKPDMVIFAIVREGGNLHDS
jgi:hypothetical protein